MIKTILLVAQTQNFNDAAYLVPCSQSSVSRRVDAAEAELRTKLLTRPWDSPDRRTHLTPAGEKAIPILLVLALLFCLCACNGDDNRPYEPDTPAPVQGASPEKSSRSVSVLQTLREAGRRCAALLGQRQTPPEPEQPM